MSLIDFEKRLRDLMPSPNHRFIQKFQGTVFRNVKQRYATRGRIVSTDGSFGYINGRYHIMGEFAVLYLSGDLHSCIEEVIYYGSFAPSGVGGNLPRTFIGVKVEIEKVLDLTDSRILGMMGISTDILIKEWAFTTGVETQIIGKIALEKGFEALKVPSARWNGGYSLNLLDDNLQSKVVDLLSGGKVKVINDRELP